MDPNLPVIVTWVQAPLFSTNPQINQTGKYLNLFHTALVFRQETFPGPHTEDDGTVFWTLEYDSVNAVTDAIVPLIRDDGELEWHADARWCLRNGIYNGLAHWTTNF